ncbi:MAG: hypothetical protein IPM54_26155 [Polyangiaceae bacterium]|nr:hypothetical protein [Polyangiaceae bacterium]
MTVAASDYKAIRDAIASFPTDVSTDAIGAQAPTLDELYAPETHAAALDPTAPIVMGARGTGKSFWAGVLGDDTLRATAAAAYPKHGLSKLDVQFGYTGIEGPAGIGRDKLDQCIGENATGDDARAFFWATILRAIDLANERKPPSLPLLLPRARDVDQREATIAGMDEALKKNDKTLLVVYDALDTMAMSWPRRRLLTQALLEVVWAMRAYRRVRVKLFLRPDQIEDDALHFVELPKLRTGAVRLAWTGTDLYGLLFARLALGGAPEPFQHLLSSLRFEHPTREQVLKRQWTLTHDSRHQQELMTALSGPYMADGAFGYKKGKTYDWPLKHLADAFNEVTPRSFLGLMIGAAQHGPLPANKVLTPKGMQHGLRVASKTRVDQLHQEFPWIKGALRALSGLLLPADEAQVVAVWQRAGTLAAIMDDARAKEYLPPFHVAAGRTPDERGLYIAMERIGVMFRRKDDRIDMPDLFRVAANLLKKGGTAPI